MLSMRCAAFAAAAVVLCGVARAQDVGPGDAHAFAVPAGERAGDIWTPEAMAAAVPEALPEADPAAVGAFGRGRAAGQPQQNEAEETAEAGAGGQDRSSGNIHAAPLHWSGRLFGKKPDGSGYRCSAQFISYNVVITAAHCVRDAKTGAYSHNVAFALEYANGKYRRLYKATCMRTYSGWVSPDVSRYLYDYAFVKVDARSATGHWGTSWDWLGRYDSATKTGYPRGILDGEVIQVDGGPISVTNGIVEMGHGNTANQHGSSGGAWVGKYSGSVGKNNYVISVQSFSYPNKPGVSYGPYLDGDARSLRDRAEGPCN